MYKCITWTLHALHWRVAETYYCVGKDMLVNYTYSCFPCVAETIKEKQRHNKHINCTTDEEVRSRMDTVHTCFIGDPEQQFPLAALEPPKAGPPLVDES